MREGGRETGREKGGREEEGGGGSSQIGAMLIASPSTVG